MGNGTQTRTRINKKKHRRNSKKFLPHSRSFQIPRRRRPMTSLVRRVSVWAGMGEEGRQDLEEHRSTSQVLGEVMVLILARSSSNSLAPVIHLLLLMMMMGLEVEDLAVEDTHSPP